MTDVTSTLSDLETKAAAGRPLTRREGERMLAVTELVSVGLIGEAARRRLTGSEVTFGRVVVVADAGRPAEGAEAGEVRIAGVPASVEEARALVRAVQPWAAGIPVTAFALTDLWRLAGGTAAGLTELAGALAGEGLSAVAETPIDGWPSTGALVEGIGAARAGGLAVLRATVDRAPADTRLDLIERAVDVQQSIGGLRAFAPLPRRDPPSAPSTGYDDVRTIAVARAMCLSIRLIQMDWPLYGPKLAQVGVMYGANDIDGVAAVDTLGLGPRRSPAEDIRRQIRAVHGVPVERNGRYEPIA